MARAISFAQEVKSELAAIYEEDILCQKAELMGLVRAIGTLHLQGGGKVGLYLRTENHAVSRKVFKLLKDVFSVKPEVIVRKRPRPGTRSGFVVRLPIGSDGALVLRDLGIIDYDNRLIYDNPPAFLLYQDNCRRAFLRGLFLGAGSVNSPEADYHLEIVVGNRQLARMILQILEVEDLKFQLTKRREIYPVYTKEADTISHFMGLLGAHGALLAFEERRVLKQMRGNVNRLVNAETANLNKTIEAAMKQIEDIETIQAGLGLERLPEKLSDLAYARLQYPELSMSELGKQMVPALSKSTVNHRMRSLKQIAERIRSGELDKFRY